MGSARVRPLGIIAHSSALRTSREFVSWLLREHLSVLHPPHTTHHRAPAQLPCIHKSVQSRHAPAGYWPDFDLEGREIVCLIPVFFFFPEVSVSAAESAST